MLGKEARCPWTVCDRELKDGTPARARAAVSLGMMPFLG